MIGSYHAIGVIASWSHEWINYCCVFHFTAPFAIYRRDFPVQIQSCFSKNLWCEQLYMRFPKEKIKPHLARDKKFHCYRIKSGWTQNKGEKEMALATASVLMTLLVEATRCAHKTFPNSTKTSPFGRQMTVVKSDLCSVVKRCFSLQWKVHRLTMVRTWFSRKNLYTKINNARTREYTWMHSYQRIANPTLCYCIRPSVKIIADAKQIWWFSGH